jgi:hypothetical protein
MVCNRSNEIGGIFMLEKLAKLIDVKTIVTFIVIGVFAYLSVNNKITVDQIMIVVTMIITFFFAKPIKEDAK